MWLEIKQEVLLSYHQVSLYVNIEPCNLFIYRIHIRPSVCTSIFHLFAFIMGSPAGSSPRRETDKEQKHGGVPKRPPTIREKKVKA
jgi:hypothetical protein